MRAMVWFTHAGTPKTITLDSDIVEWLTNEPVKFSPVVAEVIAAVAFDAEDSPNKLVTVREVAVGLGLLNKDTDAIRDALEAFFKVVKTREKANKEGFKEPGPFKVLVMAKSLVALFNTPTHGAAHTASQDTDNEQASAVVSGI